MGDPMDTKFKFEVKQDDQKPERKSTKLFGPGDSNVFKKALLDATKGSVGNQGKQPAAVEMEQLHAIYISSVPEDALDKDLLMEHFSQFGKVKRVYISNVRMSAIIHFENHEVANQAKMSGALLQGHKLDIFWSKSAKVYSPVPKKSPQSSPERVITSEKQNKAQPTARPTSAKGVEKQVWKVAGDSSSVTSKYTLSEEVKEELMSMSGGDITKYQERPHSLTGSTAMQALQKQKALALTRVGVRGRVTTSKRSSLGVLERRSSTYGEEATYLPLPTQVAKPKARTVPRARAKSTDQLSCAESLFALTKQQALTAEERYKILESRDKILRKLQSKGVMKRSPLVGTCPDMCPEKERYHREITNQVAVYELLSSTEELKMDHERAVKQYSRSSANQDDTLCHELRPASVLVRTMNYLLAHVMNRYGRDSNVQDWFHYLWDRTRSIRKDITQQELCDRHCVSLLEQCARFHIHCAEQLVSEDPAVFDQKINTENLTKSLQTLKYMYDDMALKSESCPCEAEFRAYMVLLNLNDSNFIWDLKQVRHEILRSSEVQFSLRIHTAIHSHNFVRFFRLVRQTTYLNACLLQRYFCQVRTSALLMICKACCPGRTRILFPVLKLMKLLAFESVAETCEFLGCCGLTEYDAENKKCVAMWKGAVSVPQPPPQTYRAPNLIESKMASSLAEVVYGCSQPIGSSEIQSVYSSFDEKGYLKTEALCISDISDSGVFRVPAGESVPKRKKTSPVATKSFKLDESSDLMLGPKELSSPDTPPQLQHPASSPRPALGVVKPSNYSFASVRGNMAPNAARVEPVFSFKLTSSKEGSALMPSAAMDIDVTSSVCSTATVIVESPSESKARPSTRVTTTKHGTFTPETDAPKEPCRHGSISTSVPTTPPFSPLQEIKPQIPSSKMSFVSFDRSKSAATSTQVPFIWKRKPAQDDDGKEGSTYGLETIKSNIGFSVSSPFFKREQRTNRGRFGDESDENAAAMRKQQEADELKKRILAEEQKRLEEEKRRVAAEKEILMLQRTQQVLGMLLTEITLDTCSIFLKELQLAVKAEELLDKILNSVVTENSKVLLDEAIHNRRLSLLVEKVKHRKMQVVCDKWRLFAARRKKHRKTAENFPPLTLLLNSPSDLYVPSAAQVGTVHLTDYSKYLKDVTFSKLDTCALVGRRMLMRMTALGWNSPDIFWKLVVSIPGGEESIYEQEASLWVHQMFTGKQHVKSHSKVVTVSNTSVIYSDIQLVSCVTCVVGCPSKEALCGMSGLFLWIPASTDDWPGVRRRLRHCVVGKTRLPLVPVAVLLVRNMGGLLAREVAQSIGLEDLVSEGYISEYNVEMPSCNSMQAIREAVVKALCWLSEHAPDPKPLVVRPLQHLLDELVHMVFKQITSTVKDTMFTSGVVQSPNNIIYLYNKVLCALQDCLMDPQLAEFSKGAPEFKALASEYEHLWTCLEDCGMPHYCHTISQVMKKAELSPIRPWPPASVNELVQILEHYCRSNDLLDHWPLYNYLERAVVEYFEHGEVPNNNSKWLEFLQSVNWTEVVQIIVSKKLESLQMLSTSTEHMQVAISKQNLSSFIDNFWWFTCEEIDTVVETPFRMSNSDKRKAAGDEESSDEQTSGKKWKSAPNDETSSSCTKRHYKEMTREIDASLRALKSLNEDIMKMKMLGYEHE